MQTLSSARGSSSAVSSRRGAISHSASACAAPRTNSVVAAAAVVRLSNKQPLKSLAAVTPASRASVVAQAVAVAPAITAGARSAAKTDVPKEQQKPTAVITGASSGLGLAATIALAKKGELIRKTCRNDAKTKASARAERRRR